MATRKKAPSKKKKSTTSKVTQLYPDGTPVDPATGEALEDVKISQAKGKKIPLDKESARVHQQNKDVMRRKAAGEPNVRWNSDFRIRFAQVKSFHPRTKVAFKQLAPVEDENIPPRDIAVFRDYDDVIRYLREGHWKGEAATYKWWVFDDANHQWATGQIQFATDQDVLESKNGTRKKEEPMANQPPPWGYPPAGGYPPPGYGGYPPPGQMGYPPHGYPAPSPFAQPPPQAPVPEPAGAAPEPAPAPPPPPPPQPQPSNNVSEMFLSGVMQQLQYLMSENARLQAQQHQPQHPQGPPPGYMEWLAMQQQAPSHQPNPTNPEQAAPPPQPPSVTDQVRDTMGLILDLNNLGKSFTQAMNPQAAAQEGEAATTNADGTPKPEEPAFPLQVKEVGPMRMVAAEGQLMKDATTLAMFNADKIGNAFDKLFDKFAKVVKDREEVHDKQAAMREKKIADLERLTAAKERWNKALAGGHDLPAAQQSAAPEPPKPEPEPEPAKSSAMVPPPYQPPPVSPQTLGVPIASAPKEPTPFATMKPNAEPPPAPMVPNPMEPNPATVNLGNGDGEEAEEAMHPAVRFAMEKEKEETGAFVMPKNPAPINTAEPEYEGKDNGTVHPAVAHAEAQAKGETPPLVNGVAIETPGEESP